MKNKVRCEFCGRNNDIENDLCLSCGAWLPDPIIFQETEYFGISGSFEHYDFYADYVPRHTPNHSNYYPSEDCVWVYK